ncbi:MAG: glycosyltransferase [Verrucomicrobia bacterium]|jgi:mannosyltransferase|nr:glycosyltransferase [Verrucomicrobiota bacterium]
MVELIIGNDGKRFSGVTSTMLQVLPVLRREMETVVLGPHHLPPGVPTVSLPRMIRICRRLPAGTPPPVFHARRNKEMVHAVVARDLFRARLRLVFTSTAQRHHTRFTNFLMRRMDALITTSSTAAAYMKRPPDAVIPHGIDTKTYRPCHDKEAAWRERGFPGKRGIGIFGRIRPSKGTDLLVEAVLPLLDDFPDTSVLLCGKTTAKFRPFEEELRRRIRAAGKEGRFLFLGERPFAELPGLFQAVSVTAAVSRSEGFGLTVLESMASATPVVATEAGAWKDIVSPGEDGFCVPVGDVGAIRSALRRLLADPANAAAMGAQARRKVESHYTIEREATALADFFRTV